MNLAVIQLCSVILYTAAALCIFMMLMNRFMILKPDSPIKGLFILTTLLVTMGGATAAGLFLCRQPWIYAPAFILVLVAVGEVRQMYLRRTCSGSGPIDSIPHSIDLANPVTTMDWVTHRYEVVHPAWQGAPLRIVQITDMHVHPSFPVEYYQDILKEADKARPDLVVFTGDFISTRDSLERLARVLRPVEKAVNLAVLGNHDYWTDPEAVRTVIRSKGLRLLTDESMELTIRGRKVTVTGYDYPWRRKDKAVPPWPEGSLHIVLSHTPDNIFRLAAASADIVFSGHCHAGQGRIPFIGPVIVPSVYGRRFDHGHFIINGTHLFVASGIGASLPPVRIYCQPDVFIVDVTERANPVDLPADKRTMQVA